MKVFGVSNEMWTLIKELASQGDPIARKANIELLKTNNGREPQLASLDGENAIATMMAQLSKKSIDIQKAKMPKKIPFLVPGTEPVFIPKKIPVFNPFNDLEEQQVIAKKTAEKPIPFDVQHPGPTPIIPKEKPGKIPVVEKAIPIPIQPDKDFVDEPMDSLLHLVQPGEAFIEEKKKPSFLVPGTEPIDDRYYPDIDPDKIRWIIDGPGETKRELNKAVIPIAIGLILYFLVWS